MPKPFPRSRFVLALFATAIASSVAGMLLVGAHAAGRGREGNETPKLVRWDIAKCHTVSCGALVIGGHAVWRSASGATFRFTGSGEAEVAEREAAGGGSWIRKNAAGQIVAHGAYQVTGFIDWHGLGGSLGNVTDAVGHRHDYRNGILKLHIDLLGKGQGRLVISSVINPPPSRPGHVTVQTPSGRTIKYLERIRPNGQPLFHHLR
jgi:hypothetical protein